MPAPPVDPMPLPCAELRLVDPLDAQDASYLAASARISSFLRISIRIADCQRKERLYRILYSIGEVMAFSLPKPGPTLVSRSDGDSNYRHVDRLEAIIIGQFGSTQ